MSKSIKIILLSICLLAGVSNWPGNCAPALAAQTYTAPPAQAAPDRDGRSGRIGQALSDPSQPAAALRSRQAAREAAPGQAMPVYLDNITAAAPARLAEQAFFLLDPSGSLGIEQAGAPARQDAYTRLLEGVPLTGSGVFWLRFSVANADPAALQQAGARQLRLPPGTPAVRMYLAQEFAKNGDVRRWREIAPVNGAFILPDPLGLPLTIYMKFDGVPGLWFNPEITTISASPQGFERYLPLAVPGFLGLAILVLLLRGLAGREEWRLWGAAVMGCALVQTLFCRQSPELGSVYLTALPSLLAPGLIVMLMPHLGRHLLQSRERRVTDWILILLSLPGAAAALLPLVPGLGWSAKFLPLAPLLLLPLLLVAASALARRRPGGMIFFLACFLPLLGALLALLGLGLAEMQLDFSNPLYRLGPALTGYGYAAAALVMMLGGRAKDENREDFFPLEISAVSAFNTGAEQDLKLYPADALPPLFPQAAADGGEKPEAESFPLDEDGEPALRIVRLYTPETREEAKEQAPEAPQLPELPADSSAEQPDNLADSEGETEETKETVLPQEEAPAEAFTEEPPFQEAPQTPAETAPEPPLPLEPALAPASAYSASEAADEAPITPEAPLMTETPEEPAAPVLPPAPAVEDATRAAAPFNLADVVWYKDKEEPGLVIIKPGTPAARAEAPLPPPRPETDPQKAAPGWMPEAQAEADEEPLELTELATGPNTAQQADADAPLPPLPPLPEAQPVAETETPAVFLAGLDEIMPGVSLKDLEADEPNKLTELPKLAELDKAGEADETAETGEDSGDSLSGLDEALNCLDRLARAEAMNKADLRVFNLSSLVRRIHAETAPLAESRGLALSWFVSPSLDLLYKGDEKTLRLTLSHMLRGAVESARDGAIQLAVRPAPEGENLVRFSLTDSALTPDSPRPPARLLSRAWELACASQGSFSIEFVPERGSSINFSLRLKPLEDEDYIEAAQNGFPTGRRPAPKTAPPKPLRLAEMTGLEDPAPGPNHQADLDGPLEAEALDGVALSGRAAEAAPSRDSIVIADPADSGRRLIARRLGALPYAKVEAASLTEAAQACSWGNVALLILDGEQALEEISQALKLIEAEAAAAGRPPLPSLALLSHLSQSERLLKAGCSACQVKSENREQFQALVQQLIQEPPAQSPRQASPLAEEAQASSMLDMIVSSLDSESAELEKGDPPAPEADATFGSGALTRISGNSEYMDSAMVPMIPSLLDIMRENLRDLEAGAATPNFDQVREVTASLQAQSKTYGLSNLERMAACVERAAQAKDREAVRDLAEELILMCRRYLNALQETHDQATR